MGAVTKTDIDTARDAVKAWTTAIDDEEALLKTQVTTDLKRVGPNQKPESEIYKRGAGIGRTC